MKWPSPEYPYSYPSPLQQTIPLHSTPLTKLTSSRTEDQLISCWLAALPPSVTSGPRSRHSGALFCRSPTTSAREVDHTTGYDTGWMAAPSAHSRAPPCCVANYSALPSARLSFLLSLFTTITITSISSRGHQHMVTLFYLNGMFIFTCTFV